MPELPFPSTNITAERRAAFDFVTSGDNTCLALLSCFVNGSPAAAIVHLQQEQGDSDIIVTPLFVSVTDDMVLTDHDGIATSCI